MGALYTVDTPTVISGCGLLVVPKGCLLSFDILRHFKIRNCWESERDVSCFQSHGNSKFKIYSCFWSIFSECYCSGSMSIPFPGRNGFLR